MYHSIQMEAYCLDLLHLSSFHLFSLLCVLHVFSIVLFLLKQEIIMDD